MAVCQVLFLYFGDLMLLPKGATVAVADGERCIIRNSGLWVETRAGATPMPAF